MKTVIKVENISKEYRLGEFGSGTISRDLNAWWAKMKGKDNPNLKIDDIHRSNNSITHHKALTDVSFEVNEGDVLGIIGKNGAGKSTLLKILSRVTTPTAGTFKVRGRIASLLEVGTGFHPDLTGRDNIYLNGAILGMKKWEIKSKFDEIVDFSGVEKFIDTPVKRYSSGMYVRLAFAVAAHLEPEILIVDEVLAVGDAEFQKKCLGKMKDVSTEGRTVLFVSHNMAAVNSLCKSALVLEKGAIKLIDTTENAVSYYLKGDTDGSNKQIFDSLYDKNEFCLHEISLNTFSKTDSEPLIENEEIELKTIISFKNDLHSNYHITYHLYNEMGEAMFSFYPKNVKIVNGKNKLICAFPKGFFNSGTYYLSLFVVKNQKEVIFVEKDIMSFAIIDGDRPLGSWMGKEPGYIKPVFNWRNEVI